MEIAVDILLKMVQIFISALFFAAFIQTDKKALFVALSMALLSASNTVAYFVDAPVILRGPVNMVFHVGIILLFSKIPLIHTLLYILLCDALMFLFELPVDLGIKYFFPEFHTINVI